MASFTIDPQQRMERERRRIEQKMDIRNYMPGYSNNRPNMPKRRGGEFDYELDDETRQGLLSELGENTLGALYRFGNVLDLPGSSVRDVASTLTGEPRNPFDQWLHPTTEEGRIRGRELNRQWGLAGRRDNWKNLVGGIGTEILTDPLTYLGLGSTAGVKGTGALTKHGRLLQKSGLLKKMPKYMAEKGIERARDATSTMATMGPREAMQQVRHAEDIISRLPTKAARRQAREALEATAESVGYKKTMPHMNPETVLQGAGRQGSAYEAFLRKEGEEALAGSARFGIPNWRIFGAGPKRQLRQTPHVLLGKPGSAKAIRRAAKWDERFRKMGEWPPMQHLKSLMHPKYGSFVGEIAQRMAPAFKEGEKAAANTAMRESTDIFNNFKWAFGDQWDNLNKKLSDTERLRTHDLVRGMMNGTRGMNGDQAAVVQRATQLLGEKIGRAKDLGVNIDVLDDDFIKFFPRQLSEAIKKGSFDDLRKTGPKPVQGLPNDVFTPHEIARIGPLRDIKGGEGTINELFTDDAVRRIKNNSRLDEGQKVGRLTRLIQENYGNRIPNEYRGQQINRPDLSGVSAARQAEIRDMSTSVRQQDFSDITNNTNMSWQAQKTEIDRRLREINIRTDTNWIENDAIDPSSVFDPNTRLWEVKGNRHRALANMLLKAPDEAHDIGLFGNFPLYDLEKYFQRMEDTVNRADFTMSILRHPKALHAASRGSQPGRRLRDVLKDLNFNPDQSVERLAREHGVDLGQNEATMQEALEKFGRTPITREVEDDLLRYKKMFESPEPANYFVNILDSLNQVFKVNVTSPWPAFHLRNIATGQFRNHIAGMFSLRSVKEAHDLMRAKPLDAASIPAVQRRWESLQQQFTNLQGANLTDDKANEILQGLARENNLMGPYALVPGHHATTESRMMGGGEGGQAVGEGSAQYFKTTTPGTDPVSFRHAGESYTGLPHKMKVVDEEGNIVKIKTPATTTSPFPGITPFPVWDLPLWLGRKGWGKANRRLGRTTERVERWADEPFLRSPNEWKVRDAKESLGGKGRTARKFQDIEGERLYGPSKGGEEFGHYAEGLNRLAPWLHRLREGADPAVAAREAIDAQIDYSSRNFTAFERQVLKRGVPFYSFSSRSLPWAVRKFYEEPHNMLAQLIHGTKRTGEHLQEQYDEGVEGPVPSYIRDTLAIPMASRVPGVKRFFTGADIMSQDLWQLLMPLMAGKPEEAMFEAAGRSNPLLVKYPIETLTGTSLWQRGVEGGRPLRTMSPPVGRTLTNVGETWEKATGNRFEKGWKEDLLNKFGPMERLAASSPYSRMLSSARKLFDVRKSAADKALSLGLGAGITDVSPRQQEAMLREHLRGMISDRGGYVFQKATFPKSTLREMSPKDQLEALKLKALNDERAKVAKEMKEKARLGVPGY